jgi:hypothetical protein
LTITNGALNVFKYILWLNGSFFSSDDGDILKDGFKIYLLTQSRKHDIFECIFWLKASLFSGNDWDNLEEEVNNYQLAQSSPLHGTFFSSEHQ